MPRRVVIFLGAGASKPLGFPLTGEILPEIVRRLDREDLFRGSAVNVEDCRKLRRYLETLMPGLVRDDVSLPLITDVLSLTDQLLVGGHTALPMQTQEELVAARVLLERSIFRVLTWPYEHKEANEVPPVLRDSVDALLRGSDDGAARYSIVSTNYDIAFEREIYRRLRIVREGGLGDRFDFGFARRDVVTGEVHQRPGAASIDIFKLHGSMNWLRCELCEHVYINPAGNIYHQAYRPDVCDLNTCHCGHGPLKAVMVAPSFVRDIRDGILLSVWRSALEALRTAERWILIGYSLPTEDIAIRSLMIRAFNGRDEGPQPQVHVLQHGHEAEGRYRLFFPDCDYRTGGMEALPTSGLI
jgi:NAD-dependent SIR2 family protein deacetylase